MISALPSEKNAKASAGPRASLPPVPERASVFILELESGKPSYQLEKALIVARTVGIELGDLTAKRPQQHPEDDLGFLPNFGDGR